MFIDMAKLSSILRKKREKKGAIDFDFPESKVLLDKDGNPIDIVPHERNTATKLIEDFMLAANQTVAEHFFFMESPLYLYVFCCKRHDLFLAGRPCVDFTRKSTARHD